MSSVYQLPLPNWDPPIRAGIVERAFRKIFLDSAPSRPTIVAMIEDGTLTGYQDPRNGYWYAYKSSVDNYILRSQFACQQKLAA